MAIALPLFNREKRFMTYIGMPAVGRECHGKAMQGKNRQACTEAGSEAGEKCRCSRQE